MPEKYLTFSQGSWKGLVLDGYQGEVALGTLETWAVQTRTRIVRELPLRGIYLCERPGKATWYYKTLKGIGDRREGLINALKWRFRSSRFLKVLEVSQQLQEAGFLCPKVILAARKRTWWPWGHPTDFMIMETAPGRQVSAYLDGADGKPRLEGIPRQEMLQRMGRELARLHLAGFVHGDCHPGNYFWEEGARGFCYIDNDRTKRYSAMKQSGAIRNLISAGYFLLHRPRATRDEWAVILDSYLESAKCPPEFRDRVNAGIERRLRVEEERKEREKT